MRDRATLTPREIAKIPPHVRAMMSGTERTFPVGAGPVYPTVGPTGKAGGRKAWDWPRDGRAVSLRGLAAKEREAVAAARAGKPYDRKAFYAAKQHLKGKGIERGLVWPPVSRSSVYAHYDNRKDTIWAGWGRLDWSRPVVPAIEWIAADRKRVEVTLPPRFKYERGWPTPVAPMSPAARTILATYKPTGAAIVTIEPTPEQIEWYKTVGSQPSYLRGQMPWQKMLAEVGLWPREQDRGWVERPIKRKRQNMNWICRYPWEDPRKRGKDKPVMPGRWNDYEALRRAEMVNQALEKRPTWETVEKSTAAAILIRRRAAA
jgi:hypothetical protein